MPDPVLMFYLKMTLTKREKKMEDAHTPYTGTSDDDRNELGDGDKVARITETKDSEMNKVFVSWEPKRGGRVWSGGGGNDDALEG